MNFNECVGQGKIQNRNSTLNFAPNSQRGVWSNSIQKNENV